MNGLLHPATKPVSLAAGVFAYGGNAFRENAGLNPG